MFGFVQNPRFYRHLLAPISKSRTHVVPVAEVVTRQFPSWPAAASDEPIEKPCSWQTRWAIVKMWRLGLRRDECGYGTEKYWAICSFDQDNNGCLKERSVGSQIKKRNLVIIPAPWSPKKSVRCAGEADQSFSRWVCEKKATGQLASQQSILTSGPVSGWGCNDSPFPTCPTRQSCHSTRHVRHGNTAESSAPKSWMLTTLIDGRFSSGTSQVTYTSLAHTIPAQDFFAGWQPVAVLSCKFV